MHEKGNECSALSPRNRAYFPIFQKFPESGSLLVLALVWDLSGRGAWACFLDLIAANAGEDVKALPIAHGKWNGGTAMFFSDA